MLSAVTEERLASVVCASVNESVKDYLSGVTDYVARCQRRVTELRMFYTDNFNLTAESQCERRLTDCLLINLDEYDRYSARKQSTLKNLMQMSSLRMRKAYAFKKER